MDVGQIPWTAAMEYARHVGIIDADDQDDFWVLITAMDGEYRKPKEEVQAGGTT